MARKLCVFNEIKLIIFIDFYNWGRIIGVGLTLYYFNLTPSYTGDRNDNWSVKVSGNWRVTFRMNGEHAEVVNYEDYH